MRVLVAPDKFKGTLTASEAARAIAAGWRRARPNDELDELPMADGGEGSLEILVAALGGTIRPARVSGPLGAPVDAAYGVVQGEGGRTVVVELARASGLQLVRETHRDPLRASSRGTGELIRAALAEHPAELIVCVGGSAGTDGGGGLGSALGVRLLDATGSPIPDGGAGLLRLGRVDVRGLEPALRAIRVVAAADVDNPLVGPNGAAAVFAPQKGASPEDVRLLDRALGHYAAVLHRDLGIDVREAAGAGAGGGTGAGLLALLGAHLRRGVDVVMESVGLDDRIARADLVLTGEGSFDATTLGGKVAAGVLASASRAGVASGVFCGRAEVRPEGTWIGALVDLVGERRALEEPRPALEELAAAAASELGGLSSPA